MKKMIWLFFVPLIGEAVLGQEAAARLDSIFKPGFPNDEPGAAVAIIYQGKMVFKKTYGLSTIKPKFNITPLTNFNIGSLTKQFTAYAVLQLADQKKLSLEDPLIHFFPDFNPKTGSQITVKELLTHSSGILDHYNFTDTISIKHATDRVVLNAVKDLDTTYFEPGSKFRYSNTGYCLLAMIIERVSGMTYEEYLKKFIFHPLGMHQSAVYKQGNTVFQQATGYTYDSLGRKFRVLDANQSIFFSTEGDGGIYTSIEDYLKWFAALQDGKYLNRQLVQEARSAQFPIDPGNKLSYGFGWFVDESSSPTLVYHYGSNGGFQGVVFTVPSINYAVIIFTNQSDVDLKSLLHRVNQIFHIPDNSSTKTD